MESRLPDLSYLPEEERWQLYVDAWTTTVKWYEDRVEHTQHVMVPMDDLYSVTVAKQKKLYFWHSRAQTYACDVCAPIFGEVMKKQEEQIASSFGMPSVVMGSLSGTGTSLHKDFSMSRKELAEVEKKRQVDSWEQEMIKKDSENSIYSKNLYPHPDYFPPVPKDLEPLFPLAPDFRDYYCPGPCAGTCKHKRLTVQEAYEFYRDKYGKTGFSYDLEEMLSYVSGQVPPEPRDERAVEPKPWEIKLSKFEAIGVFLFFVTTVLVLVSLLH